MEAEAEKLCEALSKGIMGGHKTLTTQLDKYYGELEEAGDGENVSSDLTGFWRRKAAELTEEVLEMSGRYMGKGAEKEEDPLVPLRRAMEDIADLVQGLTKLEAKPNKANLRNLGREMNKAKGSMMLLGQVLMLNQDPTLAASAHKLVAEAEEAIRNGQQRARATLRKMGLPWMSPRLAAWWEDPPASASLSQEG
jgi:hypothetical protein